MTSLLEQLKRMNQETLCEAPAAEAEVKRLARCCVPTGRVPVCRGAVAREVAVELPADAAAEGGCPAEVDFILSAQSAGVVKGHRFGESLRPAGERRGGARTAYRTAAKLRLYSAGTDGNANAIYTRDIAPRSLGFITRHRLPLGYGGLLRLRTPEGREVTIDCVVHRCRETVLGWYEGVLSFNRDQKALVEELGK